MPYPFTATFSSATGPGSLVPTAMLIIPAILTLSFGHPNIGLIAISLITVVAGVLLQAALSDNRRLRIEVGPLGISIRTHAYCWISHLDWSQIDGIEYIASRARPKIPQAIALIGRDNTAYVLCTVNSHGIARLNSIKGQNGPTLEAALEHYGYQIKDPVPGRQVRSFQWARLQPIPMICSTVIPADAPDSGRRKSNEESK